MEAVNGLCLVLFVVLATEAAPSNICRTTAFIRVSCPSDYFCCGDDECCKLVFGNQETTPGELDDHDGTFHRLEPLMILFRIIIITILVSFGYFISRYIKCKAFHPDIRRLAMPGLPRYKHLTKESSTTALSVAGSPYNETSVPAVNSGLNENWKNAYEYILQLSLSADYEIEIVEEKDTFPDGVYGVYITYTYLITALGTILLISALLVLWSVLRRSKGLYKEWTADEPKFDGKHELFEISCDQIKSKLADENKSQDNIISKCLDMEQNVKNYIKDIVALKDELNLMKLEMQLKFAELSSPVVKEEQVIKPIASSHSLNRTLQKIYVDSLLELSSEVCLTSILPDEATKAISAEQIIDLVNQSESQTKSEDLIPLKVMKATSTGCIQTSEASGVLLSTKTESRNELPTNPQTDDTTQAEEPLKLINSKLCIAQGSKSSIPRKCDIRAKIVPPNNNKPKTQKSESSLKLDEEVANASKTQNPERRRSSRQSRRKVKK